MALGLSPRGAGLSELESAFSPEEQLVLLLCSTKRRQIADHDMAVEMLERCDRDHFLELLIRCNLVGIDVGSLAEAGA